MASNVDTIAVAVADEIARASDADELPQTIGTSERKFLTRYTVDGLKTSNEWKATVSPIGWEPGGSTRQRLITHWVVHVAVHKYVSNVDADVPDCIELVEQIDELFARQPLPGVENSFWVSSTPLALYDVEKLDRHNVYIGVIELKFGTRKDTSS